MNIEDIKKPENIVYKKTPLLTDNVLHYCPGCSHGTVHKLVAEVIEEMGIQEEELEEDFQRFKSTTQVQSVLSERQKKRNRKSSGSP